MHKLQRSIFTKEGEKVVHKKLIDIMTDTKKGILKTKETKKRSFSGIERKGKCRKEIVWFALLRYLFILSSEIF